MLCPAQPSRLGGAQAGGGGIPPCAPCRHLTGRRGSFTPCMRHEFVGSQPRHHHLTPQLRSLGSHGLSQGVGGSQCIQDNPLPSYPCAPQDPAAVPHCWDGSSAVFPCGRSTSWWGAELPHCPAPAPGKAPPLKQDSAHTGIPFPPAPVTSLPPPSPLPLCLSLRLPLTGTRGKYVLTRVFDELFIKQVTSFIQIDFPPCHSNYVAFL